MKNKEKDLKNKQKAYRHLASRGFISEDIIFALNQILYKIDKKVKKC